MKSKLNKVILYLTFSDVFTWGVSFILTSLAGIYLATKFDGNVVEYIGLGTFIYYITRAIFQLPIGSLCDKIRKDGDEIIMLMAGNVLMGLSYLMYPLITSLQAFLFSRLLCGVGAAFNLVAWRKLFAQNLNPGKEGKEYAGYDTIMSVLTAVFSVGTGYIANVGQRQFDAVIIAIGILMILSAIWPLLIFHVQKRRSGKM